MKRVRIATVWIVMCLLLCGCGLFDKEQLLKNETAEPTPTNAVPPTGTPVPMPTFEPTPEPTIEPTGEPTGAPEPTIEPTGEPTGAPEPTLEPTPEPTPEPTVEPEPDEYYELVGLAYVIRDGNVYSEASEDSPVIGQLHKGEFVALEMDDSVFSSETWSIVQYKSQVFGYVPVELISTKIPKSRVEFRTNSVAPEDWITMYEHIRDKYWMSLLGESLINAPADDTEDAMQQYRKSFSFREGKDDHLYTEFEYVPFQTTKLYVDYRNTEVNSYVVGTTADGEEVYYQELCLTEEGATLYDARRTAITKDGQTIKEYEFTLKGNNRVLLFGTEEKPESILAYRYSDIISMDKPYSRMDFFYNGETGLLENAVMTIAGDTEHMYNTFFGYRKAVENGQTVYVPELMLDMMKTVSDDKWTLRYGVRAVPAQ